MTFAPDDLKAIQAYCQRMTGLPWASLGITHQKPDGGGYHEGHDLLHQAGVAPEDPGSDYSYTESDRDRSGLTDAASAFDLGDFDVVVGGRRVTHLDVIGHVLVAVAAGDPRVRDLREVIYSVDNVNVKRWDRLKVRSSGDSSHLTHTHLSFFRDSEGRRARPDNFLGLLVEVFEGRNATMALEEIVPKSAERAMGVVLSDIWNQEMNGGSGFDGQPSKRQRLLAATASDVAATRSLVEAVRTKLDALALAGVDVAALAQAVAVKLAPLLPTAADIARAAADEEAKRLSNG